MDIITSKQDVLLGEEILLLCKAGAEGEIMWLKDGEEIVDEEKVTKQDETSSKLRIKNATMQDVGKYSCVCDFDSGYQDDVFTQLYVYEGPSFGSTNTYYHEFLEGTDGIMPCLVMGQPAVDVHWLRDGEEISSNGGKRVRRLPDNTVLIEKVKRKDAGTYVCRAQIRGRPIYQQLPFSVVVNAPPSVRLREEVKKVLAGPETNVSLLCLVDGLPKPNITWNMPVTFDPLHHQFNSDRSQLTIKFVARGDYGEYICTATNKIAESTATFMLHVYEAPEVFVSAEQQSVSVGERVSVSCNVSGHPQPELHWLNKQNGRTLDSGSGHVRVEDGALVIDEVVPSDGGLYSCMAVSNSGNASRDIAIYTKVSSMTKGTVFGIVMVIFLVVFLVVDATCCYRNRCGLLMSISTKLFGQKVPGLKMLEEGEGTTNGEVKLNGLSTPRGSVQNAGVQTFPKEGGGGALPDITCDKASLTKHEKKPPGSDTADA
ncbi:LOW QUALITY PROTEIN: neural cell adhesion molecule 1 [Gymnodraco acuticeps]|uniref:LOW QUALITY PROTEIN: neural cell adhesion molecule 1 n=1 Tax=Gymnodraco acuticeps TaxID=8218 RepID=A0A6P8U9X2_GYMAC|nr:LOW QUALITY PROTEIN: neural cell adhesion molecule 1 [Gymnodraco acuticeps]